MAAALPAIHSAGGGSKGPAIRQHRLPTPPSKGTRSGQGSRVLTGQVVQKKCSQGMKERELEQRRIALRNQQPVLSKKQTCQYRNTYKHNLCLDMLQEGFHKSFAELFALIKEQNEERQLAGPESALWNQQLLENEPGKLETLKRYLSQAESALRVDDHSEVYQCQYNLARYFQSTGDKWLGDHFFSACLATATSIQDKDGGKMAAQGHCNVGLALEESGDNFGAAENFELFYKLSTDKLDWEFEDGRLMHSEACNLLSRIYTTIAFDFEKNGDLKQYLLNLKKAYEMAKEGGDRKLGGEASYRLGLAYEKNQDSNTALKYLNGYLDTCQNMQDSKGIGEACEAIAKSYESQGKVEEAIKYLEMFVDVAEKSKDDKAISRACSDLGAMFNTLGRYDQAVDFFNKSYNIARAMNDTETISSSRVLFGVAAAHKMMEAVTMHIDIATKPCLGRLIEWKDNRGDEFDKPIPEPVERPPSVASSVLSERSIKLSSPFADPSCGSPEPMSDHEGFADDESGGKTADKDGVSYTPAYLHPDDVPSPPGSPDAGKKEEKKEEK